MKTCFKCGERLPLVFFYKHSQMADGHLNKCIECTKRDVRNHRAANDNVREYDRERSKLEHRVKMNTENTARWRSENPERAKAHNAVSRAVRSGKLNKQPCQECGSERVEAHHPDYSKPLDVVWLCPRHHRMLHLAKTG